MLLYSPYTPVWCGHQGNRALIITSDHASVENRSLGSLSWTAHWKNPLEGVLWLGGSYGTKSTCRMGRDGGLLFLIQDS